MSEAVPEESAVRGGPQLIPRPATFRIGPGAPWAQPAFSAPAHILVADVRAALARRPEPSGRTAEVPVAALPGASRQPAAVLCALFDEGAQAHVVLTRRSSRLRSHTHQVSFPGGRIDPGEDARQAALREAREEIGIDPATVDLFGRLTAVSTPANPAPITPLVGQLPARPSLVPNPAEVERAYTVPLVELIRPDVYRQEVWVEANGRERPMEFFELIGDTVWGATARMLRELLDLILAGESDF